MREERWHSACGDEVFAEMLFTFMAYLPQKVY